ncbi:MAG: hypothetical protein ABI671_19180 [Burkholderiales bacterium]
MLLQREQELVPLPSLTMPLQPGDRLLFRGRERARAIMRRNLVARLFPWLPTPVPLMIETTS